MPGKIKSSLRNNWVYGIMDRQGEPLAWVGRNIKYDTDHTDWIAKCRQGREPNKFRFPNQTLFRRGSELYGQEWLDDERFEKSLAKHGLILVEGFNDRIRLHELGVMSVAMMSNTMTNEQTHKLISFAKGKANDRVGIMHDANRRGDDGAKESLWRMHQAGIDAYLIWSHSKHGGKYADREPESLSKNEWEELVQTNGTN